MSTGFIVRPPRSAVVGDVAREVTRNALRSSVASGKFSVLIVGSLSHLALFEVMMYMLALNALVCRYLDKSQHVEYMKSHHSMSTSHLKLTRTRSTYQ